jgi:uncharacterized membrane-anchored protein
MKQVIKDNIGMILAAHMVMLVTPALVHAEGNYNFINFTEPLKTERGELAPIGPDAVILSDADLCRAAKAEWGWESCDGVDQAAFSMGPDIDTMMLLKPVSEGYVKLDDFEGEGAKQAIDSIETDLKQSLADQSKRIGRTISFKGWRVYPTADRQRNLIYYALDTIWDGKPTTSIKVMMLDRYGYLTMEVIPYADDLGAQQVKSVLDHAVAAYSSKPQAAYTNFESGDKVAAYGGLGVLATVLGVKYGKAATAGLVAMVIILLKKAWFIVVLPFLALGGLFKRMFGRKTGA